MKERITIGECIMGYGAMLIAFILMAMGKWISMCLVLQPIVIFVFWKMYEIRKSKLVEAGA